MEKKIYANGNFVGVQFSELTEEEKINKRISEINFELKHVRNIYKKYTDEQLELRHIIKSEPIGFFKANKIRKQIMQHRFILNGIRTYITVLKGEKSKLSKSHPKNMKPKELTDEEKALKKENKAKGYEIAKTKREFFNNSLKEIHQGTTSTDKNNSEYKPEVI